MKGHINKRNIVIIIILVLGFATVHVAQALTAEPGSDSNPIVAKDYVDSKVDGLSASLDSVKSSMDNLNKLVLGMQKSQAPKFEVIELEAGKKMLLGNSTEMILRGGKATAISGDNGGLSDLTSGTGIDIQTGQNVPLNHLLLASRSDGRGIKVESKAWILVKGEYTIK